MEEYKEYSIHKGHTDEYDVFIICLSFESIAKYLEELAKEDLIKHTKGNLLIDQLLITGNGSNRFLLLEYDHGEICLDTAENIEPDKSYRSRTSMILKEEQEILNNSILTDYEKELINNSQGF